MDRLKTTLTLVLTRHASMNSTLISRDKSKEKIIRTLDNVNHCCIQGNFGKTLKKENLKPL